MSYLNVTEIESALQGLSTAYPSLCQLITLPNATHEGRTSHAIRLALGPLDNRQAMLFIGGQHAREWGSGEICVNFATDLLEAYDLGTGLVYGGQSYTAAQVQQLLQQSQVFVFACVNPDGRNHSQTSFAMWRKNRNPVNAVDLNRNYDFVWDFNSAFSPAAFVSVSDDPTSDVYHGTAPFSEPETQNVRWLLDSYPQIRWFIDIHSYSQLLYHAWGDDENQTAVASQNFLNPAHHGARGVAGDAYGEYIRAGDLAASSCLTGQMQSALQAVRGINYSTGQSYDLYPTSGTATDYPYSRHFADPSKTRTLGFLIEWGSEFQPPWAEMENIILDVSSALVAFALAAPCVCSIVDANLLTPVVNFNDIPEGELTPRAIVFSVTSCGAASFQIVSGPTTLTGPGSFGTLASPSASLPAVGSLTTRESRLWLSHTGTSEGDVTTGTVTVQLVETGEQWIIPLSANTIARPTVGTVLVLDQSGSMEWPSGLPGFSARNDVLKFAAPVFVNLLHEDNGLGIVAFDHNAYDRMSVQTVGPVGPFDPVRATALGVIGTHTPNPLGGTAIGDGVESAHNLLGLATGYDEQAMVVFTDGDETAAKYINQVTPLINERVFAIGLGTAEQIKPVALTALTNGTGGYLLLTGVVGPDDLFRLSKYYLQILAGVTNYDIVLDPEAAIKPGQVHRIPFYLNEADIGVDTILLGEANLPLVRFALETPAGDLIDPGVAGVSPSIDFVSAQGVSFYRMSLPVPIGVAGASAGKWHAVLKVDEKYYKRYLATLVDQPQWYQQVAAHGVRYSLSVQSYSGFRLQARLLQSSNQPGASLTVRAVLTEYGLPVEGARAQVRAEFSRPDGTSGVLTLHEEAPATGIYVGDMVAALSGVYPFRVLVNATTMRGRAVTREHLLSGAVWQGGDTPPPGGRVDPDDDREKLCQLLGCLLSRKVIEPDLEKRLKEAGLNLDELRHCLKVCCRDTNNPS
ncbi:MAG: M14 family zinc carboxypeptidase [Halopseudomonas sp.]